MGLTRLGNYIEQTDIRNDDLHFNEEDVKGISTTKQFIETKADLLGVSLKSYKVIRTNEFVYVADTSRRGDKIGLAYCENKPCIVSSIYTSFRVNDESKLLPRFLMMFFNRGEFDRYTRFNSWGSARETFTWEDMCDIKLDLPPIEIQKKYVAVYESLLSNLRSYESKLEDLKLVCDGYIEDLRKKYPLKKLGSYISEYLVKNVDNKFKIEKGISTKKELIDPKAHAESLTSQKVFFKGTFCFATNTARNADRLSIALNDTADCVVSPTYCTFRCNKDLNPSFLNMMFQRAEFDRYVRFNSWGSVREMFFFDDMKEVKIPIPPIEIQKSIVNVFDVYNKRKDIINKLKEKISTICPILIRGAIKEGEEQDARL